MTRTRKSKHRGAVLTGRQDMELLLGPSGNPGVNPFFPGSGFATETDREAAYWLARPELRTNPGTRPWAFWRYEARAQPTDESLWLAEHDALEPEEEALILTWAGGEGTTAERMQAAAAVIRERRGIIEPS